MFSKKIIEHIKREIKTLQDYTFAAITRTYYLIIMEEKTKCYPCNGTGKVRFFNSTISICNLCKGKGYLNIKQGVAWKNIHKKSGNRCCPT